MVRHPGDELLAEYASGELGADGVAQVEEHLSACAECRSRVDEVRAFERLITNPESWIDVGSPPEALPEAIRKLSSIAARNRREDEAADTKLSPLIDRFLNEQSGKFLWADLASRPEYHTGGVVRKLAQAADQAQYAAPLRALLLAETASAIVGMLSMTVYSEIEIAALRGLAWKQQANANRQLGRLKAAVEALDRAERAYRQLPRPELDLASVIFIRATVYYEQQNHEEAADHAKRSSAVFEALGQTEQYLAARFLEGAIALDQEEVGRAQPIFDLIHAHGEATGSDAWIARTALALGHCHCERQGFALASHYFHHAERAFQRMGNLEGAIRSRWGLAILTQREGQYRTAMSRLRDVRAEFVALGDLTYAALVTLDIMETLLALGQTREVRRTAGNVVELFKEAGIVSGAITAADYLKQAALTQNVSPSLIDYIRRYLRRVDLQPDLAFMPPDLL